MKKKLWILSFIMAMIFMMAGANFASASIVTLTDRNSVAKIDTDEGMNFWALNEGANQLNLQWFWFRIGAIDENNKAKPINELADGVVVAEHFFANNVLDTSRITLTYTQNNLLSVETGYTLKGTTFPGAQSDISESIRIKNLGTQQITLTFFQYNDFNLAGTAADDNVEVTGPRSIVQWEDNTALAEVVLIGAPTTVAEAGEAGMGFEGPGTSNPYLLQKIVDGDLTQTTVGVPQTTLADAAWAFQWTFTMAPGGEVSFSKDKNIVTPVPTTLLLFGSGLFSLLGVGIRRRKS